MFWLTYRNKLKQIAYFDRVTKNKINNLYKEIKPYIQANQTITFKNVIAGRETRRFVESYKENKQKIDEMRAKITESDIHYSAIVNLESPSMEVEMIAELNVRIREAYDQLYSTGEKITYGRLANRLDMHYPGITKQELAEHNSELLNQIIKEYDQAEADK